MQPARTSWQAWAQAAPWLPLIAATRTRPCDWHARRGGGADWVGGWRGGGALTGCSALTVGLEGSLARRRASSYVNMMLASLLRVGVTIGLFARQGGEEEKGQESRGGAAQRGSAWPRLARQGGGKGLHSPRMAGPRRLAPSPPGPPLAVKRPLFVVLGLFERVEVDLAKHVRRRRDVHYAHGPGDGQVWRRDLAAGRKRLHLPRTAWPAGALRGEPGGPAPVPPPVPAAALQPQRAPTLCQDQRMGGHSRGHPQPGCIVRCPSACPCPKLDCATTASAGAGTDTGAAAGAGAGAAHPWLALSLGSSMVVNRKWPRWLVPNWYSKPWRVSIWGQAMTPALFSSTSMGRSASCSRFAASLRAARAGER